MYFGVVKDRLVVNCEEPGKLRGDTRNVLESCGDTHICNSLTFIFAFQWLTWPAQLLGASDDSAGVYILRPMAWTVSFGALAAVFLLSLKFAPYVSGGGIPGVI